MDPCTDASDTSSELPSSPSNGSSSDGGTDDPPIQAAAAVAAAEEHLTPPPQHQQQQRRNRYDEQKKRDWSTFQRFLENRKPRLTLSRVRSPHVIEFLKSIDNFGKTLVHEPSCPFFGRSDPPTPCSCPLRQSWGSLDSLVGRLRAACEDSPTRPETNPFGVRAVRNYLLQVKDSQATARGIPYSKRRKNRVPTIDGASTPAVEGSNAPPGGSDALVTLSTSVAGEESSALPDVSAAADASNYMEQEASVVLRGCSAADTTAGTSVVREGSSAPPGAVPLLGSFGQDAQTQLQICWVRPPVLDNQSAPPFLPIWRCPNVQSLVPFLPPFPYIPVPTTQRAMENELRVPKQESQSEEEDHVMEPSGTREGPSSSDEASAGDPTQVVVEHPAPLSQRKNRYEEQKRRDWNTFLRFLENRQPRLTLSRVRSPHVIEFLKSMDQFGKTLVHEPGCSYFGISNPDAPCTCPLRQSWGSLDSLVGRLRAACEESPNRPESNPFGVRAVRNYLLQVKDSQATARGIPYSKKRKRSSLAAATVPFLALSDGGGAGGDEVSSVGATSAAATDTSAAGEGPDAPEGASSNYGGKESATTTAAAVSSSASVFGEDGAVVASATTPVLGEGYPAPLSSFSPIYLL